MRKLPVKETATMKSKTKASKGRENIALDYEEIALKNVRGVSPVALNMLRKVRVEIGKLRGLALSKNATSELDRIVGSLRSELAGIEKPLRA